MLLSFDVHYYAAIAASISLLFDDCLLCRRCRFRHIRHSGKIIIFHATCALLNVTRYLPPRYAAIVCCRATRHVRHAADIVSLDFATLFDAMITFDADATLILIFLHDASACLISPADAVLPRCLHAAAAMPTLILRHAESYFATDDEDIAAEMPRHYAATSPLSIRHAAMPLRFAYRLAATCDSQRR